MFTDQTQIKRNHFSLKIIYVIDLIDNFFRHYGCKLQIYPNENFYMIIDFMFTNLSKALTPLLGI